MYLEGDFALERFLVEGNRSVNPVFGRSIDRRRGGRRVRGRGGGRGRVMVGVLEVHELGQNGLSALGHCTFSHCKVWEWGR